VKLQKNIHIKKRAVGVYGLYKIRDIRWKISLERSSPSKAESEGAKTANDPSPSK
jgi:hypothetical protein